MDHCAFPDEDGALTVRSATNGDGGVPQSGAIVLRHDGVEAERLVDESAEVRQTLELGESEG